MRWGLLLSRNWWKHKYITQHFHHNGEDVIQETNVCSDPLIVFSVFSCN